MTTIDITRIDENLRSITENKLVAVGELRRGVATNHLEYLTTTRLNLIGTLLSLPNSVNLRDNIGKIEYTHSTGATVTIRYVSDSKQLPLYMFYYTGPKEYVNKIVKELEAQGYEMSRSKLSNKDGEVAIKNEKQLFATLSKILQVTLDMDMRDSSTLKKMLKDKKKNKDKDVKLSKSDKVKA